MTQLYLVPPDDAPPTPLGEFLRDYAQSGRDLLDERRKLMTRSQLRDLRTWFDSMDASAQEWEATGVPTVLPPTG